jgi:DNA-binding CsgD family transcriptional regulator
LTPGEVVIASKRGFHINNSTLLQPPHGAVLPGIDVIWLRVISRKRAIDSLGRAGPHEGSLLHEALSTLTPLRQQLLRLAVFDGLSHEEIARASGLAPRTVKSHVRRAMLAMRSVVEPAAGTAS